MRSTPNIYSKLLLASLLLSTGTAIAIPYEDGFVWNRFADYKAEMAAGSPPPGGPLSDQNGNQAWSAELYEGWGNWDNSSPLPWQGKRWSNMYGNVSKWDQNNAFLSGKFFRKTPLARWTNPVNETIDINIGGALNLFWLGRDWTGSNWSSYLVSGAQDVWLTMGYYDASEGSTTEYFIDSQLMNYPGSGEVRCGTGYGGWANCLRATVDLDIDVTVDAGDSIFWTSRAVSPYTNDWRVNRWLTLNDRKLNFTLQKPPPALIPEPSTLLLLGLTLPAFLWFSTKTGNRTRKRLLR